MIVDSIQFDFPFTFGEQKTRSIGFSLARRGHVYLVRMRFLQKYLYSRPNVPSSTLREIALRHLKFSKEARIN